MGTAYLSVQADTAEVDDDNEDQEDGDPRCGIDRVIPELDQSSSRTELGWDSNSHGIPCDGPTVSESPRCLGTGSRLTKVPARSRTQCRLNKVCCMSDEASGRRHKGCDLTRRVRDSSSDEAHHDVGQQGTSRSGGGDGSAGAKEETGSLSIKVSFAGPEWMGELVQSCRQWQSC